MSYVEALEHYGDGAQILAPPAAGRRRLRLHRRGEPARAALEALLPARTERAAGRVVLSFEHAQRLVAVLGLRAGADCRFTAEDHFRRSAERELERSLCVPVERRHVVELDGLHLPQPRHAGTLFTDLVAFLHGAGFQWAVASISPRFFKRLEGLEFDPVDLTSFLDRESGEAQVVCCGSITAAYRRLAKRLARDPEAADEWNFMATAGRRFRIDRAMRLLETVGS